MSSLRKYLKEVFTKLTVTSVKIDRQPNAFTWLIFIIGDIVNFRKPNFQGANRFYSVNKIPPRTLQNLAEPPRIISLVVSTEKDFDLLRICLPAIVSGSINQIDEIVIIVPNKDLDSCNKLVASLNPDVKATVLDEDSVLPIEVRARIKHLFGKRYGWVLQQLLTVEFVLKSKAKGVLVVNSDTVLIEKLLWLDHNGKQLLMPSWEYNPPYYDFLSKLSPKFQIAKNSFISHHMLMQPEILRSIFAELDLRTTSDLFEMVENFADLNSNSPVCLEFELYAQGILTFFPEQTLISKWSNRSLSKMTMNASLDELCKIAKAKNYRSASIHSWS
jgi:hypothetical protein